jgi:hypothetical protein
MFVPLPLLCLISNQASIESTPEWVAYQHELARHKSIKVGLYMTPRTTDLDKDQGFQFLQNPNGDFVLRTRVSEVRWIGTKGILIDETAKTWKLINQIEDVSANAWMLGLLNRGQKPTGETWDVAWKLTREPYAVGSRPVPRPRKEVGYEMSSFHIDAGFAATWWFDVDTHLITAIETQNLGPTAQDNIQRSAHIQFEFSEKPVVKIDLSPPAGYKRVN